MPRSTREAETAESRARMHEPEEGYSGVHEAEEDVEDYQDVGSDEPFSAQVLRRMHQDALVLLEEYDEMHGPLEHTHIKDHLKQKLEGLVSEIDGIEAMFDQHHPDLPELDGAMGSESEDASTEPPVEADSERPEHGEEVSGEEAATAMMTKSFFDKVKSLRFKVKGLDTTADEVKSALAFYRKAKDICPHCGKKDCPCKSIGTKAIETKAVDTKAVEKEGYSETPGVESNLEVQEAQEPFSEDQPFQEHHWSFIDGAHEHLGELKDIPDHEWNRDHQFKSYHFHKLLHSIVGDLPEEEAPGEEEFHQPEESHPEHEITPEGLSPGEEAEEQEEKEGVDPAAVYEPEHWPEEEPPGGSSADKLREKYTGHKKKWMGKDEEAHSIKRRRTKKGLEEDDYETKVRATHHKAGRPYHRAIHRASKFLETAAQSPVWDDEKRALAGEHYTSLGEVRSSREGFEGVQEEIEDIQIDPREDQVGAIEDKGVKDLMKTASEQSKAIKNLIGKLGLNGSVQ